MLRTYAAFLRRRRESLHFQLTAVVTTAEVLTPSDRTLLESTFGARVYNEYGCGELGTIAHECERGSMHLNSENLIVEILDGPRHCSAGEVGELVITELNNTAMPLVRYRIGDFAAFSRERCACGRSLPALEGIYGREYDLIYNRSGHMFHGEFFMYIAEEAQRQGLGIGAFQIIQDAYDHFTIRVQAATGYGPRTEDFVRQRITDGYGPAEIDFVQVDRIPREASGKMRLIVGMKQRSLGHVRV
jgi:phenylacetate-CoA ligase